jgi:hypothetical protein
MHIRMLRSTSLYLRSPKLGLFLLVLLATLGLPGRADASSVVVTVTKKTPVETLAADGSVSGVSEVAVGTKYTWVSTDGTNLVLADASGAHYEVATAATDYVPAAATPTAAAPAPTTPQAPVASASSPATAAPSPSPAAAAPTPAAAPAPVPASAPISGSASQNYAANDTSPDFGPNVLVFDSSTPEADIQSKTAAIFGTQERNQFGPERNAILFKPGQYNAKINLGFYTQVYGLGKSPDDTTINGEIKSSGDWNGGNGTCNFWRGVENLAIAPAGNNETWAVSQAAPFRRVHVKGELRLFEGGWTSGGYMADCKVDERVVSGSQQQWYTRNSTWSEWDGGVWNMVFQGVQSPPSGTWPKRPYTTIDQTPVISEKPFLVFADGKYSVFVPAAKKDSAGVDWDNGPAAGTSIPLSQFYIARADRDTAATMNAALAQGKNLLLTPGVYNINEALRVTRADTVVLGLGMATLSPQKGAPAMEISDVNGVKIACVLFDAGATESPVLLQVGEPGSNQSHASDPTTLYDIFCRIGGAAVGVAKTAVIINSNDVIGDNAWIWRADHGSGVGWDQNKSANGLIVNGRNVTYYGLFVEHFQQDQVLWNGENGRTYFFQCEMPYDPPAQEAWTHGTVKGYPGYKVADNVKSHEAWGVGIYCVFNHDNIYSDTAVEAPQSSDVKFHHVLIFRLSGATEQSGINSVINGQGNPATKKSTKQMVIEYPQDSTAAN